MMTAARKMRIGLSLRYLGYHAAAWRHPDVPPGGASDYDYFLNSARIAERGKLDMIFFADGIGIRSRDEPPGSQCRSAQNAELEPLTLLAALAPMTKHIGLVATASTTYNEPFHIARKYASIDHISRGRAGWNIVTSWSDAEAKNFSRDEHLDYATRYDRAKEFVEVVTGLWDSWEADAFPHDKASGVFFDPEKLHALNHRGKHFQVRGPLSAKRTPQGRPILVQAGASEQGRDIAAAYADVVYAASHEIGAARAYYADLKSRMQAYGRHPDAMKIMLGLTPVVGRTADEAQAKYEALQALVDPLLGLSYIYGQFGDLSAYPLDGPVPEPVDPKVRSMAQSLLELARRDRLTIRQLYLIVSAGFGGRVMVGSAKQIADDMEEWFTTGAADGFNICPTHLPGGGEDFVALVVPELQRRGLFRTEYEGTTLRQNLGLEEPENRYTKARKEEVLF
jgi:FMN-dependent oxidoreductase (nitrilotriacetate monooxygenase family)